MKTYFLIDFIKLKFIYLIILSNKFAFLLNIKPNNISDIYYKTYLINSSYINLILLQKQLNTLIK